MPLKNESRIKDAVENRNKFLTGVKNRTNFQAPRWRWPRMRVRGLTSLVGPPVGCFAAARLAQSRHGMPGLVTARAVAAGEVLFRWTGERSPPSLPLPSLALAAASAAAGAGATVIAFLPSPSSPSPPRQLHHPHPNQVRSLRPTPGTAACRSASARG